MHLWGLFSPDCEALQQNEMSFKCQLRTPKGQKAELLTTGKSATQKSQRRIPI
jgi:hypothetical protein